MRVSSPVLESLARRYERCLAGRTGEGSRDMLVDVEELLRDAGASEGESRAVAEQQLRDAEKIGILKLEPIHKRDQSSLGQVRFSPANEADLFLYVGRPAPEMIRIALAEQFHTASTLNVPERWQSKWKAWCEHRRLAASAGKSVEPFDRLPSETNNEMLELLPKLLAWQGESLVRFVSCVLCKDSKKLESLAAKDKDGEFQDRLRGKLGKLLAEITGGEVQFLDDLGILPNPRFALIHGPLRIQLDGEWLDLGKLKGAFRLAESDICRAQAFVTPARRCLTIENETSFHELAKLQPGELLVQTSYPGSGTLKFLQRLSAEMEFWHFGDSDEAGFDILRVLRAKSGRNFQPLHMERGRKLFEQESLGRPQFKNWPFYG